MTLAVNASGWNALVLGLVFRFLYHGTLSILSASIVVFTLATIAAKVRGLDITCG